MLFSLGKYNVHKKCAEKVPMTCTGEAPKDYSLENELLISVTGNGDGKSESGSEMADSSLVVLTRDEDSDGESENSAGEVNELPDEHAKTPDEQLSIQSSDQLKSKFATDDEEVSELVDGQKLNQVR